ncbi:MAG TPA: RNA polymerase sigma-70 factor, partial [Balneola sp.]|nr:RNA polymerase sigma-70 factor [Balneola sp.]
KEIDIQVSVKVYLYQAVRNQSLNLLDKQKNQQRLRENFLSEIKSIRVEGFEESNLNTEQIELIKKVWETVNKMPERRRLVFELHRKHGFSYKEIAKILEITVKTVENHMSQALQYLRENIEINKLK